MSTTTPTIDLPRSKVRHRTVDGETGEIIERVVPATEFREEAQVPDPPAYPTKPKPPTGSVGWIAVQWSAYEEAKEEFEEAKKQYKVEAKNYWDHFAEKLTRKERRDLARTEIVAIIRPFEPAWQRGDRLPITDKMTAVVHSVTEIEDGYRTEVVVEDFRSFYLKPIVGGSSKPKSDERGYGIPVDAGTEEQARLDGAYTQAGDAFNAGDVLEDKLYNRIHAQAQIGNALAQSRGRVKVSRFRLETRLNEARKAHRRSTVRHLERQLESLAEKEGKPAA